MATPTIPNGEEHFTNTIYQGNGTAIGSGGKTITGLEFKPDFTWIKNRDASDSHGLYDSSRGVTKQIESDNTSAETTESEGLTSFTSDGFTLGSLDQVNTNNESFVGWNWKANGGTTASNTDGSITSTVQADTTSGFSIVKYTGNGSNATIGHGLSLAPSWIMVKNLSQGDAWKVYHHKVSSDPQTDYLVLNTTGAVVDDATVWNDTAPTSTVFSIGTHTDVNTSSENYVAYCWHEVDGFSKFGTYKGNGSTDGSMIYTGFRPAWLLIKRTDSSTGGNWSIIDNTRYPANPIGAPLLADTTDPESGLSSITMDLLSNGFKIRNTLNSNNASGASYIYMAFAEHPFVGDGTSPVTAR